MTQFEQHCCCYSNCRPAHCGQKLSSTRARQSLKLCLKFLLASLSRRIRPVASSISTRTQHRAHSLLLLKFFSLCVRISDSKKCLLCVYICIFDNWQYRQYNMSFTRQLSEMSASELNDAIDDTNFPQSHILSRGRNNSVCSTSSTSGTSSLADRVVPAADEAAGSTTPASVGVEEVAQPTRPRLILKSSASIPENDGTQPITPMTPRTTTTPGSGAPSGRGGALTTPRLPSHVCVCAISFIAAPLVNVLNFA